MRNYRHIPLVFILSLFLVSDGLAQIIDGIKEVTPQHSDWLYIPIPWVIIDLYGGDINGNPLAQCDIAQFINNHLPGIDSVHCCDTLNPDWSCYSQWNPYNPYDPSPFITFPIDSILRDTAGIESVDLSRVLSIEECKAEFGAGRPIIIRIDSPGHYVLGYGIKNNNLYFLDPWYGHGLCVQPHGNVLHGNRRWTHTRILTTDPPNCSSPLGVVAIDITENSVTLNWKECRVAETYDLQYKLKSATHWSDTINVKDPTCNITGLTPNREYEVRLRSRCPGMNTDVSDWIKDPIQFITDPSAIQASPSVNIHRITVVIPGHKTLFFTTDKKGVGIRTLDIIDLAGNTIQSLPVTTNKILIDKNTLSNGIYILRLYDTNETFIRKAFFYAL